MKLAIGADHHGIIHKSELIVSVTSLHDRDIAWLDCGCSTDICDYPQQAFEVVQLLRSQACDRGILICGTGVGMAIAANRFKGIYAALAWSSETAALSRQHDNANILVIPADYVSAFQAISMVRSWLEASFEGGRHQRRIEQIDAVGGA